MWICALHEYSAGRGQKRALNPLKVELWMTVNQVLNIKPESSARVMSNLWWTISAVTKTPHDFYHEEMLDFAKGLSCIGHVISIFAFIYAMSYIYSFPYVSREWSNVTMTNIFLIQKIWNYLIYFTLLLCISDILSFIFLLFLLSLCPVWYQDNTGFVKV